MSDNVIPLRETPMLEEFSNQNVTTDRLLKIQCDLSFKEELKLLRRAGLGNGVNVLDLGCGNGAYLRAIEKNVPGAQCFGLERDDGLAERARVSLSKPEAIFTGTAPADLPSDIAYDLILSRYLALHLPDLSLLGDMMRQRGSERGRLLLIDAADCYFEINRPMPQFMSIIHRLRSCTGVNRSLHADLEQLERRAELVTEWRKDIVIHSDQPGKKEQILFYMMLNASFANGGKIDDNVMEELLDWYFDLEATAQYGLFGALMRSEDPRKFEPKKS